MDVEKYVEDLNRVRPQSKKKNTKKWCKGKVGREHIPKMVLRNWAKSLSRIDGCGPANRFVRYSNGERVTEPRWYCYHEVKCIKCGKILVDFVKDCLDNKAGIKSWW